MSEVCILALCGAEPDDNAQILLSKEDSPL